MNVKGGVEWEWKSRSWSIFFPLSHWTTLYYLLMNAKGGTVPWVGCHQGECPVHRKAGSHSSSPPSRPLILLIFRWKRKRKVKNLVTYSCQMTTDLPKIKVHCTLNMDQNLKFKKSGIILLWSSLSFAPCYMMTKQEEGGGGWLMNVDKSGGILR